MSEDMDYLVSIHLYAWPTPPLFEKWKADQILVQMIQSIFEFESLLQLQSHIIHHCPFSMKRTKTSSPARELWSRWGWGENKCNMPSEWTFKA